MGLKKEFWSQKRVLVTGHTGFKGAWLSRVLHQLDAKLVGYSNEIPTKPSFFELTHAADFFEMDVRADILDRTALDRVFKEFQPEIVFHLAAQALVIESYTDPFTTYNTNVMGSLNVLTASRDCPSVKTVVNITTDKCYENKEKSEGYIETDELGGYDPYSSSKACSEILSSSFRRSFFDRLGKNLITVRAGNVIGGGDWAKHRLVPDFVRAIEAREEIKIRNPNTIRPWQHVLEPVSAYLNLAQAAHASADFNQAWNVGPNESDFHSVEKVINTISSLLSAKPKVIWGQPEAHLHETKMLTLNSAKIQKRLGWKPRLNFDETLRLTAQWYEGYLRKDDLRGLTEKQIDQYFGSF